MISGPSQVTQPRILVTGGVGALGRRVVERLLQNGFAVVVLDPGAGDLDQRVLRVPGSVVQPSLVRRALEDVGGIVHLGGMHDALRSELEPDLAQYLNVEGTCILLEEAVDLGIHPWVVHRSSAHIYDDGSLDPPSEEEAIQPINVLGDVMADTETVLEAYGRATWVPTLSLRFTEIYGDGTDHFSTSWVERMMTRQWIAMPRRQRTVDLIHLQDASEAVLLAIKALQRGIIDDHSAVNIGSGMPCTYGSLIDMMMEIGGVHPELQEIPSAPWMPQNFVADCGLARDMLVFEAEIDLRRGVEQLFLQRRSGWLQLSENIPKAPAC